MRRAIPVPAVLLLLSACTSEGAADDGLSVPHAIAQSKATHLQTITVHGYLSEHPMWLLCPEPDMVKPGLKAGECVFLQVRAEQPLDQSAKLDGQHVRVTGKFWHKICLSQDGSTRAVLCPWHVWGEVGPAHEALFGDEPASSDTENSTSYEPYIDVDVIERY